MSDLFGGWDIFQYVRLKNVEGDVRYAKYKADEVEIELRSVKNDNERLKLMVRAMWALVKDHTGLSDAELKQFIDKIQRSEAPSRGPSTNTYWVCKTCSHKMSLSQARCPYCGNERPDGVSHVIPEEHG